MLCEKKRLAVVEGLGSLMRERVERHVVTKKLGTDGSFHERAARAVDRVSVLELDVSKKRRAKMRRFR